MSRYSCKARGHVTVGIDPECLVCGKHVLTADPVGIHIDRPNDELTDIRSIATTAEWGPAGTGT